MVRSFSDRVLGGVCGGLAARLRLNAWAVRLAFVLLTILSQGAFAVLYLLLWWLLPLGSFVAPRRGLPTLIVLLLIAVTGAAWWARDAGMLRSPAGGDLFWAGAGALLALVFCLKQLGGRV